MSLLMEALKRAEEAKRQAAETAHGGADSRATAEPAGPAAAPAEQDKSLADLATRLELLDEQFVDATRNEATIPRAGGSPVTQEARDREAVQNLFTVKPAQPSSKLGLYLGAGVVAVVVALASGAYIWREIQPKSGIALAPGSALPPTSSAGIRPMSPGQEAGMAAAVPVATAPPAPAPVVPDTPASPAPAALSGAPGSSEPFRARAPEPSQSRQPTRQARAPQEPTASESRIPIRVTSGRSSVNPDVAYGYRKYASGDLAAAREAYEKVLRSEPHNSDALHGLAALSVRQGDAEAAHDFYLRALESDPKDAAAQAALINLHGQADPVQSESRLKTLLANHPDAHFAYFAQGNLYSRQGRWSEAQQAYFRAYTGEADNPDYQYNLAVSLDHLGQGRVALQYYRSALNAAANRPAAFDTDQVAARIRELQQ